MLWLILIYSDSVVDKPIYVCILLTQTYICLSTESEYISESKHDRFDSIETYYVITIKCILDEMLFVQLIHETFEDNKGAIDLTKEQKYIPLKQSFHQMASF